VEGRALKTGNKSNSLIQACDLLVGNILIVHLMHESNHNSHNPIQYCPRCLYASDADNKIQSAKNRITNIYDAILDTFSL
jgi:hypothetical protein